VRSEANVIPRYVRTQLSHTGKTAAKYPGSILDTAHRSTLLHSTCHKLAVFTAEGTTIWTRSRAIYRIPQLYLYD